MIGLMLLYAAVATPAQSAPPSHDYTTLSKTELLDFRYSFPTIVGTYPALLATIRADQSRRYSEALARARRDAGMRVDKRFPFHRHEFWRDWTEAGISWPIISLQSHTDLFTGGAHGNHVSSALLWDTKSNVTRSLDEMFDGATTFWTAIEKDYCAKLDLERLERGFPDSVGCPHRNELTIVPVDTNSDFKFDTFRIIADPYVAGSYAEGEYRVELPVTHRIIAAVKPESRELFEAQREQ